MKGSLAVSWGLLLLCALHACALGHLTAEKSGSCPQPPSYPRCEELKVKPVNRCSEDQQCPGKEKCCYYGCSLQCIEPLQEKLGSCQDYDREICKRVRPLPDECESDSQCPGAARCCCRNCRKACWETVKSGICPPIKAKCEVLLQKPNCTNDSGCPGRQKCCSFCGNTCLEPEPENPGICPVDPEIENQCGFLPPPLCSRDRACAPNEKCCRFGCGVQCVKALTEKSGVCPNILAKCKEPRDAHQCQRDSDCLSNKKCCDQCGNKCSNPDLVHDGFCPAPKPVRCDAKYSYKCRGDSECEADEKCCDVGCRTDCVKSVQEKSGSCPFIKLDGLSDGMCNKCNDDKDCPGNAKCCAGRKGRECKDPQPGIVIVKDGECPPLINWCDYPPPYRHQCDNDGNCSGEQKCCTQICTRECVNAVPVKPHSGTCPPDNKKCSQPEENQCKTDSICKENEKCCYSRCGLKCVPAVPVKPHPGSCPPDNIRCIRAEDNQCETDSTCKENEKCCTWSCGLKCVPAVPEKAGQCPVPTTICTPAASQEKPGCTQDSDCDGAQKCCIPLCKKECTDPIPEVKPGVCPKDTAVCKKAETNLCEKDWECSGNERCCYFRCGKKCKAPETVHPGACPFVSSTAVFHCPMIPVNPACSSDSQCQDDQKCCKTACGIRCVNSVSVKPKPGTCPEDIIMCIQKEDDQCKIDGDCTGDKKCCKNQCGLKCVDAVKESPKPGMCPPDPIRCSQPADNLCKNDNECQGNYKCCHKECGLKCVAPLPVTDKDGSCPLPPSFPTCKTFPTKPKDQCTTDLQCKDDEKCCEYGCSRQCKKPLQDKLGFCPNFDGSICITAKPAPAQCSKDVQCEGTQRCCCHGLCRMECTETVPDKPGICPRAMEYCKHPLPEPACKDDSGCKGKMKCCYSCGWKCIPPAENPGFCPAELEKEAQCGSQNTPQCKSDSDCARTEKCCMFGCGVQCVKALAAKPGMCPAILAKCSPPFPEPECQTDGGCLANKKCCQLCGNKCLPAVPDHDGVCPSYINEPVHCPANDSPSCNHDWNCEKDQKCCKVGCKIECVKALKEKMGFCPNKVKHTDSADHCDKCNTDKDCPGMQKCCAGVKGRECIPPLMFTGLPLPSAAPDTKV